MLANIFLIKQRMVKFHELQLCELNVCAFFALSIDAYFFKTTKDICLNAHGFIVHSRKLSHKNMNIYVTSP